MIERDMTPDQRAKAMELARSRFAATPKPEGTATKPEVTATKPEAATAKPEAIVNTAKSPAAVPPTLTATPAP